MSFFNLGSKASRKIQSFTSKSASRILPGNDPLSKIGRNILDSSANRLLNAGLEAAGVSILGKDLYNNVVTATFRDNDTRVRIALSPGSPGILYKDPNNQILAPLLDTGGVLFPYTPTINISYSASYGQMHPTHSNFAQHSYGQSNVDAITVVGTFTANTADEARYLLAVLHFMRSAHKMFFGRDALRGTPPPVLRFSGYGPFQFNSVPCVLQAFSHDFEGSSDYIEVPLASSPDAATKTMVPTIMNINFSLLPIYSKDQIGNFSLESFARGDQIGNPSRGGGFI